MGEVFLQLWWGEAKSTDWTTVEAGYSGTCIVICIIIWDIEEIMQNDDEDEDEGTCEVKHIAIFQFRIQNLLPIPPPPHLVMLTDRASFNSDL